MYPNCHLWQCTLCQILLIEHCGLSITTTVHVPQLVQSVCCKQKNCTTYLSTIDYYVSDVHPCMVYERNVYLYILGSMVYYYVHACEQGNLHACIHTYNSYSTVLNPCTNLQRPCSQPFSLILLALGPIWCCVSWLM